MASSADPFLPIQGSDAVRRDDEALQREDFDLEDESEPDVLPGERDETETGGEPPVGDTPFRTPQGDRVDPAGDL